MASNLQVQNTLSATAQFVQDQDGNTSPLALSTDEVKVGGNGSRGQVAIFDENTNFTINLGGPDGPGRIGLGGNGSDGVIAIFDANTNQTIKIDGRTGDVQLLGGDCAEDFDVEEGQALEPGTVMTIGDGDKLQQCTKAYDKKVAGVLSGAGDYRPGIVLDKQQSSSTRKSVALLGKVYCKVDARYGGVEVGDLLTTSPTPGHAMKADDPIRAFGTVIGKALRPLTGGQGLIPILIALQ